MFRDFYIDEFVVLLKAQTQKKVFQDLAQTISYQCLCDPLTLMKVFDNRLSERTFGMEAGVAVFDVQSSYVQKPVLVLATLENMVDFKALDGNPVNIVAAVISPKTEGAFHLQKLSWISRLLKNEQLCNALRSAREVDAMRVLFLPDQEWIIAA